MSIFETLYGLDAVQAKETCLPQSPTFKLSLSSDSESQHLTDSESYIACSECVCSSGAPGQELCQYCRASQTQH